ncbi:MAG: histidine--tRNA ligase [Candidatus Altimarinota bacterium]
MNVLDTIRSVFESYGYLPLETPIVERMEVLTAKFAVGDGTDVSKEIFRVMDQGDRELGLRFDMTVPLCRYVAMNPTIKLPFKRYVMGQVFRDGPIKLGRYREFWQADADIVGVPGPLADSEGVLMAADVFRKMGLEVTIYCSSRELLQELMDLIQIEKDLRGKAIIALDKLKKIGSAGVAAEMKEAGLSQEQIERLLELTSIQGTNEEKLSSLEESLPDSPALKNLRLILGYLSSVKNVVFDPSLARGLEYYTGFFFECFLNDSKITSSLVGTGRYDKIIGQFMDGKQDFPAVGISFGVSVICDALKEKTPELKKSLTDVYVVPVSRNELSYAMDVARQLREHGIRTDMDLVERGIGKNFAFADALGIPYVVVLGEEELSQQILTVKDMKTGEQNKMKLEELVEML